MDVIDDITFIASAYDKNVDDETKKLAWMHLSMMIVKYSIPNPFTEPILRQTKRELRMNQQQLKKEETENQQQKDGFFSAMVTIVILK